jgi:putative FmdB family regulatory protein
MPFYEYECPNCGYRDEVLQKINDKPLKKCPSCGKNGLKKLMSAPVFRLKGSGWYETDFKSDKDNKRNLSGADKDEPKSETKAEAKVDAKPEKSAEKVPEKSESSKATEKASSSARKPAAKGAKPKAKSRTAKRPARR